MKHIMQEGKTMDEEQKKLLEKLRKEVRSARIVSLLSLMISICLLGGLAFLYFQAMDVVAETRPLIKEVANIESDDINEAVDNLNVALKQVDWTMVSEKLDQLDVDDLNDKIKQLDVEGLNEKINQLDVDSLNKMMKEMDVQALNDRITALDVDTFNEKLKELNVQELNDRITALDVETFNKKMKDLDMEQFSKALETLNNAAENIQMLAEKLSGLKFIN